MFFKQTYDTVNCSNNHEILSVTSFTFIIILTQLSINFIILQLFLSIIAYLQLMIVAIMHFKLV